MLAIMVLICMCMPNMSSTTWRMHVAHYLLLRSHELGHVNAAEALTWYINLKLEYGSETPSNKYEFYQSIRIRIRTRLLTLRGISKRTLSRAPLNFPMLVRSMT